MATWRDRLLELMDKSDYSTLKELTIAAGISQGSFNQAMKEGGHTPKKATMDKVAKALGTTSQYILYGEQRVPGQMVPVLTTSEISSWLTGTMDADSAGEMVAPPRPMDDLAFAWRNNAEDMSEEFPIGSLVFFSTSGCLADFPMRSFVLTGKQVNAADSDSEKRIYESIHFSQLVMTMHGLRLVSLRPEISESTVIGERSIIGFAKYSIRQY